MALDKLGSPIKQTAGQKAALDLAVSAAAAKAGSKRQIQQLAGTAAQQAGQDVAANMQAQGGQALEQGEQVVQQQAMQSQEAISGLQQGLQKQQLDFDKQVFDTRAQVDNNIRQAFQDFEREGIKRGELNDITRLAYLQKQGASARDLDRYKQDVSIMQQNLLAAMEHEYRLNEAAIQYLSQQKLNERGQKILEGLQAEKQAIQERMLREKAEQQRNTAILGTVGTVGGAVAGAMVAGPAGAAVGAQLGSSVAQLGGSLLK